MKKIYFLGIILLCSSILLSQNLALTATPSASASSAGNYGPSNWNDGIVGGTFFGWVGTAPNFPQPSWIQYEWPNAITCNNLVLINVHPKFAPPTGNAVAFLGSVTLQAWNGTNWNNITTINGTGIYGDTVSVTFPPVTTTRLRLNNFVITGGANPGFCEIQVFNVNIIPPLTDLEVNKINFNILQGNPPLMEVSLNIKNVGNQPATGGQFSARFRISGQNAIQELVNQTIQPGDSITFTFNSKVNVISSPSPLANQSLCGRVIIVNDTNNANDSICESLSFLSVSEITSPSKIRIYPNPSTTKFYVSHREYCEKMQIISLNGLLLKEIEVCDELYNFEVNHQLPTGTYLLLIFGRTDVKSTPIFILH